MLHCSVAWAPDSLHLASGADDCCIFIWDGSLFENAKAEAGASGEDGDQIGDQGVTLSRSALAAPDDESEEERQRSQEARGLPHGAVAKLKAHAAPVLATKFTYSVGCASFICLSLNRPPTSTQGFLVHSGQRPVGGRLSANSSAEPSLAPCLAPAVCLSLFVM